MTITKRITYSSEGFDFTLEPIEDSIKVKKTKQGYEIRYLTSDLDPDSPRNWDNLGTMVCFHKRYDLGDKTDLTSDNFDGWEELEDYLVKEKKAVVIAPLYMYDHSGISIKIGDFYGCGLSQGHARFDSGQIGFIYVDEETLKKEYNVKKISKKIKDKARKVLEGEVDTYDEYVRGEVYTIVKETYYKNKEQLDYDCVGGYFGYNDSLKALETEI